MDILIEEAPKYLVARPPSAKKTESLPAAAPKVEAVAPTVVTPATDLQRPKAAAATPKPATPSLSSFFFGNDANAEAKKQAPKATSARTASKAEVQEAGAAEAAAPRKPKQKVENLGTLDLSATAPKVEPAGASKAAAPEKLKPKVETLDDLEEALAKLCAFRGSAKGRLARTLTVSETADLLALCSKLNSLDWTGQPKKDFAEELRGNWDVVGRAGAPKAKKKGRGPPFFRLESARYEVDPAAAELRVRSQLRGPLGLRVGVAAEGELSLAPGGGGGGAAAAAATMAARTGFGPARGLRRAWSVLHASPALAVLREEASGGYLVLARAEE